MYFVTRFVLVTAVYFQINPNHRHPDMHTHTHTHTYTDTVTVNTNCQNTLVSVRVKHITIPLLIVIALQYYTFLMFKYDSVNHTDRIQRNNTYVLL